MENQSLNFRGFTVLIHIMWMKHSVDPDKLASLEVA